MGGRCFRKHTRGHSGRQPVRIRPHPPATGQERRKTKSLLVSLLADSWQRPQRRVIDAPALNMARQTASWNSIALQRKAVRVGLAPPAQKGHNFSTILKERSVYSFGGKNKPVVFFVQAPNPLVHQRVPVASGHRGPLSHTPYLFLHSSNFKKG